MNPWTVWRIRRIHTRRWAHTCAYPDRGEPCGIAYWADASGRHWHGLQYGHRPYVGEEG